MRRNRKQQVVYNGYLTIILNNVHVEDHDVVFRIIEETNRLMKKVIGVPNPRSLFTDFLDKLILNADDYWFDFRVPFSINFIMGQERDSTMYALYPYDKQIVKYSLSSNDFSILNEYVFNRKELIYEFGDTHIFFRDAVCIHIDKHVDLNMSQDFAQLVNEQFPPWG